jgi:RNA polymerase sigma-70 factor, ECF subfamily
MSRVTADPDRALVARARRGETAAFEELVARHRDVVFRVAARIVGPDEAHDVSQDALLRAFSRLERFRGEGAFRAWLLQITHNAALRALERRRAEPVDPETAEEGALALSVVARHPVTELEGRERRRRLEAKIALLAPNHRAVLVLRDVEGLAYEEIASITESPLGSVKGRLHRARDELIEMLRANTYDWELPR